MKSHILKKAHLLFFIMLLLSCETNRLTDDDYEILEIVINHSIRVYELKNDAALKNISDSTAYYKKYFEISDEQNYESDYYYTLDNSLFVFDESTFIKAAMWENKFHSGISGKSPVKFDFSKIKTKDHLIKISKASPLTKSGNYIGDFKISRIYYNDNKATLILVDKRGDRARQMIFFKKENNKWEIYGGRQIPYTYNNEEIVL